TNLNPELTAVFDVTIAGFVATADPNTAFMLLKPTGAGGLLATEPAGTAISFWTGGTSLINTLNDNSKTAADAVAAAKNGTLYGQFGFGNNAAASPSDWGAAGNGYWYAVVTGNFGIVGGVLDATSSLNPGSDFYYGLESLSDPGFYNGLLNPNLPSN